MATPTTPNPTNLVVEGDIVPTCPLCHTPHSALTTAALLEGASWRCTRCGQMWDAGRLQTAADYSRYAATH